MDEGLSMKKSEESTYSGVARVVFLMSNGARLSTTEVARMMDRSYATGYRCLRAIEASHYVPLCYDEIDKKWYINHRN
jgi:hypothetical protein